MPHAFDHERVNAGAVISLCGLYRYRLWRLWGHQPPLTFVMLNPSTADDKLDDPIIRRCMGFARREGAGGIVVVNKFAFRATSPDDLWKASDAYGPENDIALKEAASRAKESSMPIVCAWGVRGGASNRHIVILQQTGAKLMCLGRTKNGDPRHPLYVKGDQPLEEFL